MTTIAVSKEQYDLLCENSRRLNSFINEFEQLKTVNKTYVNRITELENSLKKLQEQPALNGKEIVYTTDEEELEQETQGIESRQSKKRRRKDNQTPSNDDNHTGDNNENLQTTVATTN